jgi:CNT family concentrative nucleoside transporter
LAIATGIVLLGLLAYATRGWIGPRGQAAAGVVCLIGLVAVFSANLRALEWRTLGWGLALQVFFALFIIQFEVYGLEFMGVEDGTRPGYLLFESIAEAVAVFLNFTSEGAQFVFGPVADPAEMRRIFGKGSRFPFAFAALPTIIFVSSFFTVLYFFGILQLIVRGMARIMVFLMRTSGAESLSSAANVFMGQTEAPLIVKPYVPRMTQSELLALMVGGMATISGGLMAVYIQMGANPVAILATSVMAAPASLYLSKLLLPELGQPETRGRIHTEYEQPHRNVIDAAAAGASDGLALALNVAAMLIAFLAFLALADFLLMLVPSGASLWENLGESAGWELVGKLLQTVVAYAVAFYLGRILVRHWLPEPMYQRLAAAMANWPWLAKAAALVAGYGLFLPLLSLVLWLLPADLSLKLVFSWLFSPAAFLIGVPDDDLASVADLLGLKLATNEFVAYVDMTTTYKEVLSPRAFILCTYALTGFANFASVGIQLGGIGAMAPSRRGDLARLGGRALFVGYVTTLVNAAIAGMLLPP